MKNIHRHTFPADHDADPVDTYVDKQKRQQRRLRGHQHKMRRTELVDMDTGRRHSFRWIEPDDTE